MDEGTTSLSYQSLFAGLAPEALNEIAGHTDNVCFEAGQQILAEGGSAATLYVLQRGKVVLSARSPGRGHLLVQTLGPGEVLGLSWLIPPYQWHFDAHAVDFVEALAVDAPSIRERMASDPAFGFEMLMRLVPVLVERLQQTRIRLLDLYAKGQNGNGGSTR